MSDLREEAGSRAGRFLRRSITAGVGATTIALALASPAAAARPNNPACLGQDISTSAGMGGAGFGAFVAGMATGGGVGDEIQAHLAGDIPDTRIPNTCNDD
jgi:hypothetical protein